MNAYIVGAGPGNPDLLTWEARRIIAEADRVVGTPRLAAQLGALNSRIEAVETGRLEEAVLAARGRCERVAVLVSGDPGFFSAAAPICGGGVSWYIDTKTPIRAFHGDADTSVPLVYSQLMVDAVNAHGGNATLTVYPNCGHNCWTETYEKTDIMPWLAGAVRV